MLQVLLVILAQKETKEKKALKETKGKKVLKEKKVF